jgi:hypothetical protein
MWVKIPPGTMDIFSCEETILLAYRTSVVLLGCPLLPEIMQGLPSPVFAGKLACDLLQYGGDKTNTSNKKIKY